MDRYNNPVYTRGVDDVVAPTYNNNRGIVSSHMLFIDSRVRDRAHFPSANSFIVRAPHDIHNVHSMELVDALIPIRPAPLAAGDEMFVMLKVEGLSQKGAILESALSTSENTYHTDVYNDTFARIPLVDNGPRANTTLWERTEKHEFPKWFLPRIDTIRSFRITLCQIAPGLPSGNTVLYPLANVPNDLTIPVSDEEIFLTFEIKASN